MRDQKQIVLATNMCSRCREIKEVIEFFFDWRCASGKYRLCEACINELKNAFPKKPFGFRKGREFYVKNPDPNIQPPEYMILNPDAGLKERAFFENIRDAIRILKDSWPFNVVSIWRKVFKK